MIQAIPHLALEGWHCQHHLKLVLHVLRYVPPLQDDIDILCKEWRSPGHCSGCQSHRVGAETTLDQAVLWAEQLRIYRADAYEPT